MREIDKVFARALVVILVSTFLVSCASIPDLRVNYQLPPRSDQLKGNKVILKIEDARKAKEVLGQGAKKELEGFSGNFSLSVADYKEKGFKIGIFDVPSMLREVFQRKLENLGLKVQFGESRERPHLFIVLKEFLLDREGKKWVARMSYEGKLVTNAGFMASQAINGQAERYELLGREEADVALGEILTDLVNRLDVVMLFQKVGLGSAHLRLPSKK